jgi:branched-subunit amino acid aminotransferase/4-amino-4-deoxychorismate lyase
MDFPWTLETIQESLSHLYSDTETVIRLTVLPQDVREETLSKPHPLPAHLWASCRPLPPESSTPLQVQVVSYTRPMPQFKHGNYLSDMYHYRQARQNGLDEVLRLNEAGHIVEAAMANVFWINEQGLWTPQPERDGCLPGITRAEVISIANTLGVPVQEKALTPKQVQAMQGGFLTNAVGGLRKLQALAPPSAKTPVALEWPQSAEVLFQTLKHAYLELRKES